MSERLRLRNAPGVQKEFALHNPKTSPRTCARKFGDDEDDFDPADGAVTLPKTGEELDEAIGESELAQISEAFAQALLWAGQAKSLVEMGWRFHTMLHVFRPALVEGMELEIRMELAKDFVGALGTNRAQILKTGEHYQRVLAWVRHCGSLSQMGQRGFAAIYVIKRAAIGGRTNAALGALSNKTRQAFNKLVQDFRDNFGGYRNEVMRSDETRIKCRIAQMSAS